MFFLFTKRIALSERMQDHLMSNMRLPLTNPRTKVLITTHDGRVYGGELVGWQGLEVSIFASLLSENIRHIRPVQP